MSAKLLKSMQSAMQLVKGGQVQEATHLIQQSLSGALPTTVGHSATNDSVVSIDPTSALNAGASVTRKTAPQSQPYTQPNRPTHMNSKPQSGQFISKQYRSSHGARRYKLYIPAQYQPEQALPLVVMLHGCTQSADDFARGTNMNALADEMGCVIAYPSQTKANNPNKCWNWFNLQDQQRDQGEPAIIAGITRIIVDDYAIDPKRVYIAGLSAGGAMATIMGATYPDIYAGIGVHSGLARGSASDMMSALTAMRAGKSANSVQTLTQSRFVPTIVFHGDQDAVVATINGDQVLAEAQAALANDDPDYYATTEQQQAVGKRSSKRTLLYAANGDIQVEHWLINGAGHAWSGGNQAGTYADPTGPDASREMLRFFLTHSQG